MKLIKLFIILACIICLHRTISSSSWSLRVLRCSHVLLEIFLISTNVVACYYNTMTEYDEYILPLDIFLTSINSLALVILAVYKSKKYKLMLKYININHLHIEADPQYKKNLKYIFILALVLSMITFFIQFGVLSFYPIVITSVDLYVDYILFVNLTVSDFRLYFQFYALSSILYVMSEQLASIIRFVDEFEWGKKGTKPDIVSKEELEVFEKWCDAYTNVKESSKLFNNIYGLQMAMMVATIVLYYIVFLYSLTSLSVKGKMEFGNRILYILFLLLMLANLTILSFAAQRTQNNADILKRRLSKLRIRSLENEDSYKSTKGFLRLVSSRPIRTGAFGSISVNMSLLPTCVVFFTYYTVIALQFNNIV